MTTKPRNHHQSKTSILRASPFVAKGSLSRLVSWLRGCAQSTGLFHPRHTITIKQSSENWMTGDAHWVENYPRYDLSSSERIEDMESWAVCTTLEAIQRRLAIQLLRLFRQSKMPTYRIIDGYFRVRRETRNLDNHMVVELSITLSE